MTVSALNSDAARVERFSHNTAQLTTMSEQTRSGNAAILPASCSGCILNKYCLGSRLSTLAGNQVGPIVDPGHTLAKREHLFHTGDKPEALYIIKSGSAKLYFDSEDGREQVVDFYMPGDVLGLDALGNGTHRTSAVVLERTTLCVIQLASLNQAPGCHHDLYKLLSMELVRDQHVLGLVMKKDAEAKIARFLIGLSQRFRARGYSSTRFNLRMRRREIGCHLGIATETVSRMLTRFQALGLLQVERCHIQILNFSELERLAECQSSQHRASHRQRAG